MLWWCMFENNTQITFFNFYSTDYRLYAQYCEPRFLPFLPISVIFQGKKYFTSPDPLFVMFDDRCKSFIIRAVDDLKRNSDY